MNNWRRMEELQPAVFHDDLIVFWGKVRHLVSFFHHYHYLGWPSTSLDRDQLSNILIATIITSIASSFNDGTKLSSKCQQQPRNPVLLANPSAFLLLTGVYESIIALLLPFFPWDHVTEESVKSQDEFRESTSIVNDPKKILKLRLAKGEITKETY